MLTGSYPRLHGMRKMWGALPSPPRCKLCNAPFCGPGGFLMRLFAYGPSGLNQRLCKWCIRAISREPGGAEIEVSLLFADVRGSTSIAERMPPDEYSRLIARFYGAAAEVVDKRDGIVDKFVGDSAVALFIPASPAAITRQMPSPRRVASSHRRGTAMGMPGSPSVRPCTRAAASWARLERET